MNCAIYKNTCIIGGDQHFSFYIHFLDSLSAKSERRVQNASSWFMVSNSGGFFFLRGTFIGWFWPTISRKKINQRSSCMLLFLST